MSILIDKNTKAAAAVLAILITCGSADAQQVQCNIGPVQKIYGAIPWLVYSCDDTRSVAIVSAPGNPNMPFVFILHPRDGDGSYQVRGEGAGDKNATDRAAAELQRLSASEIAALIEETKKVQKSPQKQ